MNIDQALERVGGDHARFAELSRRFVSDMPQLIAKLQDELETVNGTQASKFIRSISEIAHAIGAVELAEFVEALSNERMPAISSGEWRKSMQTLQVMTARCIESLDRFAREGRAPERGLHVSGPSYNEASAGILVVDDDETNRKLILHQLASLGQLATLAINGREALQRWREEHHGLILTDLHMPDMGGYELAAVIRSEERVGSYTAIVAISASHPEIEAERAREAGMDDCIFKPMKLDALREVLDRWLPPRSKAVPPQAGSVNLAVLKELVGEDEAVVRDFIVDYLESARGRAAEMRAAFAAGDSGAIGNAAHRLKSASRAVGALQLGELCEQIEESCRASSRALLVRQMQCFDADMAVVEAQLAQYLAGGQ